MRVLLYTHEFPPDIGGAGQFLQDIAAHLAKLGHDVHVIVGRDAWTGTQPREPTDPEGVRVTRFAAGALEHVDYATVGVRLRRFIREWRADVLIVGDGKAMLGAGGVPLPRDVTVVTAAHGTEVLAFMATRVRRFFYERLMRRADGVIACSTFAGDLFSETCRRIGATPPPVRVVPPGVQIEQFSHPEDPDAIARVRERYALGDGPLVVGLGRLVPRKGFDVAIQAMARVRERVPDARYAIAGDGPDRARLEALARDAGVLDSTVRFLGRIPGEDKLPLLDAADAFMLLSRQEGHDVEGFGIVFGEAAMRGTPAIGGRHGGVTESVEDGVSGFLVDPSDAQAAADAVTRLLSDPALARDMGDAARKRARERFDWDVLGRRVSDFLEDVTAGRA